MAILRKRAALLLWAGLLPGLAGAAGTASEDTSIERQVKAAFLYNFLKFVDWTAEPQAKPLVIGVAGNAEFVDLLRKTVAGKQVNGREVEVTPLAAVSDGRACQIVFVSGHAPNAVPVLPGVLTVGEDTRFLDAGGVLSFYLEDNKVHFEISAATAKSAGLHISSQLLKLGKVR